MEALSCTDGGGGRRLTEAGRAFAEANMGAGHFHAKKLLRGCRKYHRLDRDTLAQETAMAVSWAVTVWRPEAGKFSTYVRFHVRHFLQRALQNASVVKVPCWFADSNMTERTTSDRDAAARALCYAEVNDRDGAPRCRRGQDDRCDVFREVFRRLRGSRAEVIRLLYVEGKILREAASAMGITHQRVEQLRDSALDLLRRIDFG